MESGSQLIRHAKPANRVCAHNTYRLDCDQYEMLRADAGDRCQLCRIRPEETPQGFLVIDHDPNVGWWAVRGLLCSTCNTTRVPPEYVGDKELKGFLANPWYRRAFGVGPELPPEPPQGTKATFRRRVWIREADRWYSQNGHLEPRNPSWKDLHYSYGAHNLTLAALHDEVEWEAADVRALRSERDELKGRIRALKMRQLSLNADIELKERKLYELNATIAQKGNR